ncbi:MAG: hypothetical protein II393_03285 [Cytophagales bacterium]|nr:hypothetical protein [Cytophagales bacterium]
MKRIKFLLFFVSQGVLANEVTAEKKSKLEDLRNKNELYQLTHKKYIPETIREDLIQCEVQKYFRIIKEINLEHNKIDIKSFIDLIFYGIRNAHIYAYDNDNTSKHLTILDIYNNIIMPQNPELTTKHKQKYFDLVDICLLDIVANYVKSTRYPQPVWDNLYIELKIPGEMFDLGIPKTVCVFKYSELITFLRHQGFTITINNSKFFLSDAIEKNMLSFNYQFIDDIDVNTTHNLKETDTKQNNKIGKEIIMNKMDTVYQPL